MLHKVKASHGDILKGLPELRNLLPSVARNKKILLEMARRGEPKPHWKTPLGKLFKSYTSTTQASYDADFHEKARKAAPHWFVSSSEQNKLTLLKMAEEGKPKPNWRTPLGRAFTNYTLKSTNSYDPVFSKKIMKLAPDWLMSRSERADEKKKLLLDMANRGGPRPTKTNLGIELSRYTTKTSDCYDPKFTREIKTIAPHWFQKKAS